jgi:hypothetical protein
MRNIIGSPAKGDDFFDRPKILEEAAQGPEAAQAWSLEMWFDVELWRKPFPFVAHLYLHD